MTRVLIAEDDSVARRLLTVHLEKWGYAVTCTADGTAAWEAFESDANIEIAILDWNMPGIDGIELCRRMRAQRTVRSLYILLCTANNAVGDVIEGLNAGADDYLTKPLDRGELRARLRVGQRTLSLETTLRRRIDELNDALAHVKQLQGLIPICMHCKNIRNDGDVWQRVEQYLADRGNVKFSHGVCDECLEKHYPEPATP